MCSYHLFLISSASVRCIPFLSFIEPIFACRWVLYTKATLRAVFSLTMLIYFSFYSYALLFWLESGFEDAFADISNLTVRLIFLACVTELWGSSLFTLYHLHDNDLKFSSFHSLDPSVLQQKRIISLVSDLHHFLPLCLSC